MDGFACIADVPVEFDAPTDGPLRSRIQVAEIGTFSDPRYGKIAITREKVTNWQTLLASHFRGRVPVDFDHNTDKHGPTGSKAAAWIVALDYHGPDGQTSTPAQVWATVEWTKAGEQSVRDREYLYISPTFVENLADKHSKRLGPALLRAALTNNPFLHDMPAISLSGATLATRDQDPPGAPGGNSDPADSRPVMPLTKIAEALGLAADADEATILEAVAAAKTAAQAPSNTPGEVKTLEAQAAAEGKVLMSAADLADLTTKAAAGAQAAEDLRAQTFETAYTKALEDGRVDAKEETKTLHRGIYDANPDLAIRNLEALPKQVNLNPRGGSGTTAGEVSDTFEGEPVDEDSATALAKAEAYAAEHKVDLADAVRTLAAQGEVTL